MTKKKIKLDYYNIEKLLDKYPGCQYYMAFGEKSNGKTYSSNLHCLKEYIEKGYKFVYLRRWLEDIQGVAPSSMFNSISANWLVKNTEYSGIVYYRRAWYLLDKDGNKLRDPFAYAMAISQVDHTNGSSFPEVKTIIFDEFLTRSVYLPDELSKFLTILSNVIRERDDVKILMLGNTVNRSSIYLNYFGLNVDKLQQGRMYEIVKGKTRLALEYCGTLAESKPSNIYFGFDDKSVAMITHGAWETAAYPKAMAKWNRENIKLRTFIIFESHILEGDFIQIDNNTFMFYYRHKGSIKYPDSDIIFADRGDYRRNWYSSITRPIDKVSQMIADQFRAGKVFFADDETGEILRNYIMYSMANTGVYRR